MKTFPTLISSIPHRKVEGRKRYESGLERSDGKGLCEILRKVNYFRICLKIINWKTKKGASSIKALQQRAKKRGTCFQTIKPKSILLRLPIQMMKARHILTRSRCRGRERNAFGVTRRDLFEEGPRRGEPASHVEKKKGLFIDI